MKTRGVKLYVVKSENCFLFMENTELPPGYGLVVRAKHVICGAWHGSQPVADKSLIFNWARVEGRVH